MSSVLHKSSLWSKSSTFLLLFLLRRYRLDLGEQEIIDSYFTAPEQGVESDEEQEKTVG